MEKGHKLKSEKRVMNVSLAGSILFMLAEGVMAYVTGSHSLLMDCIFDVTDLIMIGPFLVLVPLLYKPVTEKRPYGFSQVESLFLVIKYSVLLVVTAQLVWDNIQVIRNGGQKLDAGAVAVFELIMCAGCLAMYALLWYYSRRYRSMTVRAELFNWKLDVLSSLGIAVAFFVQVVLQGTDLEPVCAYIDPVVASVMALALLVEPVRMIFSNLKNLVLFAPNEQIMEQIRTVAEREAQRGDYGIDFLDVIQTGRKTWIDIYLTVPGEAIYRRDLLAIRDAIRDALKKEFDEVYVELIPSLPD